MTQEEALSILKTGVNVFLTGEAGSGKTHTINQYTRYLREHDIDFAVTASTGIAATHIHGMTIHSWSGIGIARDFDEEAIRHIAENRYAAKRVKKAKVLIIDEISMLDGGIFDAIERVCRKIRKGSLPFGGLQVVVVGDFFQLPPVATEGRSPRFAFESDAWLWLDLKICYLTEQHRQEDSAFLELLSAIRSGSWTDKHRRHLEQQLISENDLPDQMPRLFSHNTNVDHINQAELRRLPGKVYRFVMAERGPDTLVAALKRGCLSPERLELKEGASVMFTKNNQSEGYVNGTLGTIEGFHGPKHLPVVRTSEGERIIVEPMEWLVSEGDEVFAKITQLPLRLAWAMTIHKSQGVSLDAAVMDLSQTFEYGQGYVALSRVRRLSGVHLIGTNERAFSIHPTVLEQDRLFRKASRDEEDSLAALSADDRKAKEKNFILMCGGKIRRAERSSGSDRRKKSGETPLEKLRKKHGNAYRPWEQEEEEHLRRLFNRGVPLQEIAEKIGRNSGAIRSRIKKLGLKEI